MKKKKDNREDWDDGRVVASKRTEKKVKVEVTKEERRALRKAMFSVMLPRLLLIIAGFGIAALVIFLWLH